MNDLALDIFRTRGLEVSYQRDAEEGDELRPRDTAMPALQRLSQRHHALARALASGMAPGEAGISVGLTYQRVHILLDDPSFQELMRFYSAQVERAFASTQEQLAQLGREAMALLSERMEDEPEKFSIGHLTELAKMTADRTGNGPTSTALNVNVDIGNRLEAARKRLAERRTIDG